MGEAGDKVQGIDIVRLLDQSPAQDDFGGLEIVRLERLARARELLVGRADDGPDCALLSGILLATP